MRPHPSSDHSPLSTIASVEISFRERPLPIPIIYTIFSVKQAAGFWGKHCGVMEFMACCEGNSLGSIIVGRFMLMKRAIAELAMFAVIGCAAPAKRAGDLPPDLVWDKLKGSCPPSLDWASLRGKVVVAAFRGFYPQIADWKPLAETLASKSAIPILIYSGSEFLLDQELVQIPFSGCVLFDEKEANARAFYGGRFSDKTLVIDDRGFIAGWANGNVEAAVGSLLNHQVPSGLSKTAYSGNSQGPEKDPDGGGRAPLLWFTSHRPQPTRNLSSAECSKKDRAVTLPRIGL